MDADGWLDDIRVSYDEVAASYADQLRDALDGEPYLRVALALFAELVFGIDLSPAMIDVARHSYPGLRFETGSMTDLRLADASAAGLLSFWSLVHTPDDEIPAIFAHFRRVLRPGGPLLLGFHTGQGSRLLTQGYGGHPMKVHVHRRQPDQVAAWLAAAGLTVEAQLLVGLADSRSGHSFSRAVRPSLASGLPVQTPPCDG